MLIFGIIWYLDSLDAIFGPFSENKTDVWMDMGVYTVLVSKAIWDVNVIDVW